MNVKLIAGVAILIVIIAGVYLYFPRNQQITTTISTTSMQGTTTIGQSTLSSTTSIPKYNSSSYCISSNSVSPIYNGNFSSGTYAGWNITGVGFGSAPANITYDDEYNEYYGDPWTGYNGTYFATSYSGGLQVDQGNLTSNLFLVTEPYINFKIISPQNDQLYIQILHDGKPSVTVHYNTFTHSNTNTTNSTSNFLNASIIMVPLLCKDVQVRIVAQVVANGGNEFDYIAATGFYLAKKPISTPGIIVNQSLNYS